MVFSGFAANPAKMKNWSLFTVRNAVSVPVAVRAECFDQAHRWRGTALWQLDPSYRVCYSIQVSEYLVDYHRDFNAGD